MFLNIHIRKHERGLWFRQGDFHRLLTPGTYRLWSRLWNPGRDKIEIVSTLTPLFTHAMLDVMLKHEALAAALQVLDLSDTERALVWKDQRLAHILGPGRYAFWNDVHKIRAATFDVGSFRFEHERLASILQHADASKWLDGVQVEAGEAVLLFRDGKLVERLGEGVHVYWKGAGRVTWKKVDLREQVADVAGQEIISADKVSLRVNLLVNYQVVDAQKAVLSAADYTQTLYREAQLVLRAAIGARTLDALLADKESVGGEVRQALASRTAELGVAIRSVGLRDIILPGDMKQLFNQVIAATKEAEANIIRRREETAAARSQANTARLLAENPQLARLKELELLQAVLAGAKTTFVFGAGDIAEQVRGLVTSAKE